MINLSALQSLMESGKPGHKVETVGQVDFDIPEIWVMRHYPQQDEMAEILPLGLPAATPFDSIGLHLFFHLPRLAAWDDHRLVEVASATMSGMVGGSTGGFQSEKRKRGGTWTWTVRLPDREKPLGARLHAVELTGNGVACVLSVAESLVLLWLVQHLEKVAASIRTSAAFWRRRLSGFTIRRASGREQEQIALAEDGTYLSLALMAAAYEGAMCTARRTEASGEWRVLWTGSAMMLELRESNGRTRLLDLEPIP